MALADTLIMASLAIGGGYILIYHVLPSMQQNAGTLLNQIAAGLPAAATSPSGHRCWEIGDGTRACACAGKPYTIMGKLRPCTHCIQYCNTGVLPAIPTSGTSVSPTSTAGTTLSGRGAGTVPTGQRGAYGGPAPTAPKPTGQQGAYGGPRPYKSPALTRIACHKIGTGNNRFWQCSNGKTAWINGILWKCKGLTAAQSTSTVCYP